ncbi:hypothetical protein [Bacillus alkalisoli]|uniref:hypothetical protein n=1 Tax=Bacillus alkalisoli TaxID=2011008 RepID=UPI000C236F77|nr:hypothetical protein [Bacillus alkalisoli]
MKKLFPILFTILFISTIIVITLVIFGALDSAGPIAFYLIIAYVIFLLGYTLFALFIGIKNIIQAPWETTLPIIRNAAIYFIASTALIYGSIYIFGFTEDKGLLGNLSVPLGLATGYLVVQSIFLNKDDK